MSVKHETALTSSRTGPYQEILKSVPHSYTLLFKVNYLWVSSVQFFD